MLVFFAIGVTVAYAILPAAATFLTGFEIPGVLVMELTADAYFGFVTMLFLVFGAVMQFPIVIIVLNRLGILPLARLKASRRYALLGIVIFAVVVTPGGDPISPTVMSAVMYALYEGTILAIGRLDARDAAARAADAAEAAARAAEADAAQAPGDAVVVGQPTTSAVAVDASSVPTSSTDGGTGSSMPAAGEDDVERPSDEGRQMPDAGQHVAIISGLSGAGKTATSKLFEDLGYTVVDNLPAELVPELAELVASDPSRFERVAIVLDVRAGDPRVALGSVLGALEGRGISHG